MWKEFDTTEEKERINRAFSAMNTFEEVENGWYQVDLEDLTLALSKKGMPMIKIRLRIKDDKHYGRLIFVNRVLKGTKNDAWMIKSTMELINSFRLKNTEKYVFESFETLEKQCKQILKQSEEIDSYFIDYDKDDFNSVKVV